MTAPSRRRWLFLLLAAVLGLPALGLGAALLLLDAEALRPRMVEAVEQATGRRFEVGGMRLALSLTPTVELRDVALANHAGGAGAPMLTAKRVEVRAALLPLLSRRVEIASIVLEDPVLLLEVDAAGRANWNFDRPAAPATPSTPSRPSTPRPPLAIALDLLLLERGRVTLRDARTAVAEAIDIPRLQVSAPAGGPMTATGEMTLRGHALRLTLEGGSFAALGGGAPWPISVGVAVLGVEARLRGSIGPGTAWSGRFEANAAELTQLAALVPALPPLRELTASGAASGQGGALAGLTDLRLGIGESDLTALRPGLVLRRASLAAAGMTAPLALEAEASLGGAALTLSGTTGTPALLVGQARGALPVDLRLAGAGALVTAKGAIADARALTGFDIALAAEVADLAAVPATVLPAMGLPTLGALRFAARVSEAGPGFSGGIRLRDIALESGAGSLGGELALLVGERPSLVGRLSSLRLDLDALRSPPRVAPSVAAASPPSLPPAVAPPVAAPRAAAAPGRVIPDLPLPLAPLSLGDADLRLDIAALRLGGEDWRQVVAHLKVIGGEARISPFSAETPAGPIGLELAADGRAASPGLHLIARSPGLDLAALQRLLGQPLRVSGRAELDIDLRGQGTGTRAMAASLAGHLGLAMVEATLEPALMEPVQAALRARVSMLPALPQRLPVDCVALRVEASSGVLAIGTLLADSPAAKIAGSGTITLAEETLALRLLHDIRAAGATLRVSADLGGTLAAPAYRGVRAENLGELLGELGRSVGGDAGALLRALGARPGGTRPQPLPECGPALAAARGGRDGTVPAARAPEPAAQPAPEQPAPRPRPQPADLLRGLFGR